MKKSDTIIIGIDPGYDRVGWAISSVSHLKKKKLMAVGCIQTDSKKDIFSRYNQISGTLHALLDQYQPDQAAIESLFFTNNQKTALRVSEARGMIIGCMLSHSIKVFEYTPLQIKQAVTGYGQADKNAVEKMIKMQIDLPNEKLVDDAIDACACLLAHSTQVKTQ